MKNLLGRGICLDIDADDENGKEYNIEVQRQIREKRRLRRRKLIEGFELEIRAKGIKR